MMSVVCEPEAMPKKPVDRVTLLNVKGSPKEKEQVDAISEKTGVPLSEMARRGIAMWCAKRGVKPPPEWAGD